MVSAKKELWSILSLLAIYALLITACAPEMVEVVRTVEVEKIFEVEITPTPPGPTGTLVRALTTFPNSLDYPQIQTYGEALKLALPGIDTSSSP